ncbi:hypothetical protein PMI41_00507 [Phyllobacterium sp. YR531]|nr:hypothetical protein PMI41_00507 [Phyllobacterium sp. YR531]
MVVLVVVRLAHHEEGCRFQGVITFKAGIIQVQDFLHGELVEPRTAKKHSTNHASVKTAPTGFTAAALNLNSHATGSQFQFFCTDHNSQHAGIFKNESRNLFGQRFR